MEETLHAQKQIKQMYVYVQISLNVQKNLSILWAGYAHPLQISLSCQH
jgi:hypothetical protein